MFIDILTYTACFRTGIEPVNLDHFRPVLRSYMFKLPDERAEGEVIDLPAPEPSHTKKAQVLDADGRVPAAQLMARLPLPVVPTVTDALMATLQVFPAFTTVIGAFPTARQRPGLATKIIQTGLKEQRVVNPRSVRERKIRLETEVHANGCTLA